MKRIGQVIKLKPESIEEYKKIHKKIWPGVAKIIYECNIRNYSIYFKVGFLFSYYEYIGENYDEDMKKMAKDEIILKWWEITMAMQQPLDTRAKGEWWSFMEEIFHQG
jgi:L-rhamnose mutarotase